MGDFRPARRCRNTSTSPHLAAADRTHVSTARSLILRLQNLGVTYTVCQIAHIRSLLEVTGDYHRRAQPQGSRNISTYLPRQRLAGYAFGHLISTLTRPSYPRQLPLDDTLVGVCE